MAAERTRKHCVVQPTVVRWRAERAPAAAPGTAAAAAAGAANPTPTPTAAAGTLTSAISAAAAPAPPAAPAPAPAAAADAIAYDDVELEYSIHTAPLLIRQEFKQIFAGVKPDGNLLVVPTFQRAVRDLIQIGPEVEREKNRLLKSFYAFANAVSAGISAAPVSTTAAASNAGAAAAAATAVATAAASASASGAAPSSSGGAGVTAATYWADFIDPCSGCPTLGSAGPSIYPEVDGMQTLLGYRAETMGCCGVIVHPKWHTHCYPATLFTNAPLHVVTRVVHDVVASIASPAPAPAPAPAHDATATTTATATATATIAPAPTVAVAAAPDRVPASAPASATAIGAAAPAPVTAAIGAAAPAPSN